MQQFALNNDVCLKKLTFCSKSESADLMPHLPRFSTTHRRLFANKQTNKQRNTLPKENIKSLCYFFDFDHTDNATQLATSFKSTGLFSMWKSLPFYLSICLSVFLSVCLSVCLTVCMYVSAQSVCLSVCLTSCEWVHGIALV